MDLTYKRTNANKTAGSKKQKDVLAYCEGYKQFLDEGKTEREVVANTVALLDKNGYKPYKLGDKICKGDKLYYNNRGKALFIIKAGKADIAENGVRILVAHVDSPRIDVKQNPLYENAEAEIAYFKTHYYGGIKKYQWLTIPLALHGVIALKNGDVVNVKIGEKDSDPVFYITDLLPHLSHETDGQPVNKVFLGENLNILVGGMPVSGEEKNAVKLNVLRILNETYNITEEDFLSAELEAVPAVKARDVGFDRAFVASYGHDDRVCAYPEITATLGTETDQTVLTILADKEEIGSEGPSGMKCRLIGDIIDMIASSYGANAAVVRAHSKCLSADVTAAYDPTFKEVFEKQNSAFAGFGVAMNKFTGARGKSGSNDASAEFVGYLRSVFERDGVIWQAGELGKVDIGGGGTVAKFLAEYNIDVVDMGVPVLSMHAPYELVSKIDVYEAHKAFSAFIK